MFDFHKCNIYGVDISELSNNEQINFLLEVDEKTGEVKNWKKTEVLGLKFFLWDEAQLYLEGSFHKYFNNGKHNYNNFCISNFTDVLIDLSSKFKIDPFKTKMHNLEFGLNIKLPFSCETFLNSIISCKNKEYDKRTFDGGGHLLKLKFQQYELKIYDKGKQFALEENILRIEIKVRRMEYLKSKGVKISNYTDLLDSSNLKKLSQLLTQIFHNLLIYDDSISISSLNERDRVVLQDGRNPKYWGQYQRRNPENNKKKRKRFKELVLKHGKTSYQKIVSDLIESQLAIVTEINPSTRLKINNYFNQYVPKTLPELTDPLIFDVPQINYSNSMLERGT
jgi:hypothetical protein